MPAKLEMQMSFVVHPVPVIPAPSSGTGVELSAAQPLETSFLAPTARLLFVCLSCAHIHSVADHLQCSPSWIHLARPSTLAPGV